MISRRVFLGGAAAAVRLAAFQPSEKERILARIKPPQFPARTFDITKYGATAGAESGEAIAKAIA